MKGSYELLQSMCTRFGGLLKLATRVDLNIIGIAVFDNENNLILEKRVESVFELTDDEKVEELKDEYAYDIICSSMLMTASSIRKQIAASKEKITDQLN